MNKSPLILLPLLGLFLIGCNKITSLPIGGSIGGPTVNQNGMPVFVFVGHSNLSGRGAEPSTYAPDSRVVQLTTTNQWQTAQEPTDLVDVSAKVSPTVAFANAYVATHNVNSVGIINCAAGGSASNQWASGYPLFLNCKAAIEAAPGEHYIAGVLVWTGENDTLVSDWTGSLWDIINEFRQLAKNPGLPVVYVEMQNGYPIVNVNAFRGVEEAFHSNNIHMVNVDGLPTEDGVHLTTASEETLGQRMAGLLS